MDKGVREAVFNRAGNVCECGCGRDITPETGHLDHFFGRAKAEERLQTCWALSIECHAAKTANRPNATYWLVAFALHALTHGYTFEASRTLGKISALSVKGLTA